MRKLYPYFYMIVLLLILLSIIINCGKPSYNTETIDGVQYVHNTITEFEKPLFELEFIRRIGELDGDENFLFYIPDDIERNSKGDYLINDRQNNRVQQFDRDLNFIRTIGRNGQGPGEFMSPSLLKIVDGDELLIIDSGNHNVQRFNSNGKYSDGIKPLFSLIKMQYSINGGYIQSGIIKAIQSMENKEGITDLDIPLFTLFDQNFKRIRDIGITMKRKESMLKNRINSFSYAFDSENNHIVAYVNRNRIEKYSPDGKLIWVSNHESSFSYSNVDEALLTHGAMYHFKSVQVDNNNRIWVQKCKKPWTIKMVLNKENKSDIFALDVYNKDGILLAIVDFPNIPQLVFRKIIGDKAYFFDIDNTMAIYEYRIVEKD